MRPRTAALLGAALVATLLAGCGSDAGDGKIKITLGLFGDFGYDELIDEYERLTPNLDVVERPRATSSSPTSAG